MTPQYSLQQNLLTCQSMIETQEEVRGQEEGDDGSRHPCTWYAWCFNLKDEPALGFVPRKAIAFRSSASSDPSKEHSILWDTEMTLLLRGSSILGSTVSLHFGPRGLEILGQRGNGRH